MLRNLTGWHALVILAIVLLIFGASKLPALARSVGQSVRILKKEVTDPSGTRQMPLAGHVKEARDRIGRAALALAVGVVVGFFLANPVLDVIRSPLESVSDSRLAGLNYDSLTGAFDLTVRLAIVIGLVLSAPVWLYELLAFLAPGLTRKERRLMFAGLAAALPLFLVGCLAGAYLFPRMVEVLLSFASADDSTLLQASEFVDFALKFVLATGAAFTVPVGLVLLNLLGILPARALIRSWRVVVVGIVVMSAMITPAADVLSMFLIAVPLAGLYAAACLVAHLHDRSVARRARLATVETAPAVGRAPERTD
jgi:sec-independent protein translocase protein TatC